MSNVIDDLVNLEIRKKELEKNEKIILLLKLVNKYNTFYSNKSDCEEALMLEKLIFTIETTPLVLEYFNCLNNINEILKHIYFEKDGNDYFYTDLSARKFILFKNK